MRNIILLAAPNAGKGTLAEKLVEKYGYIHISTGDILRERVKVGDELASELLGYMNSGALVPDAIIGEALEYKLTHTDISKGFIMDGFPRNASQIPMYEEITSKLGIDSGIAIELQIDKQSLFDRVLGRRICGDCSAVYNLSYELMKPINENYCDKCQGALVHRSDDTVGALEKRYATYIENARPLLDFYKEKGVLYQVDSSDSKKAFDDVSKLLESLGA